MLFRACVLSVLVIVFCVSHASAQTVTVTITINQGAQESVVHNGGLGSGIVVATSTPRPQAVYYYVSSGEPQITREELPRRSSASTVLRALGAVAIIGGSHLGAEALAQRTQNPGLRILGVGSALYAGHKLSEWIER